MMALELQAFDQCEADGVTGLSWKEVEDCEEKFCSLLAIGKNDYALKKQEQFHDKKKIYYFVIFPIECPTEEEFHYFDLNGDGVLTTDEYVSVTGY